MTKKYIHKGTGQTHTLYLIEGAVAYFHIIGDYDYSTALLEDGSFEDPELAENLELVEEVQ